MTASGAGITAVELSSAAAARAPFVPDSIAKLALGLKWKFGRNEANREDSCESGLHDSFLHWRSRGHHCRDPHARQ